MNKDLLVENITNYIIGQSEKSGSGVILHLLIKEIVEAVIREINDAG